MQRVIYKNNPIVEVILQLRFPKILALNSQDPVDFQSAIREAYPIYQLTVEQQQEITVDNIPNNPTPSIVQTQSTKNHCFISTDGKYKINLTSNFISISTVGYTRWEEMLERFKSPFSEFVRVYNPPFFERIGLRYIDAFSREKLSLTGTAWSELIKREWLGAFAIESENKVINSGIDMEYLLDDEISRAKIHAGVGRIANLDENVFIFDTDMIHIGSVSVEDVAVIQNYLHDSEKKLFEMFITEKLHQAMGPEEI